MHNKLLKDGKDGGADRRDKQGCDTLHVLTIRCRNTSIIRPPAVSPECIVHEPDVRHVSIPAMQTFMQLPIIWYTRHAVT